MTHQLAAAIAVRLHELKSVAERDRGDGPVPTALIIAGLALLAAVVVGWAIARAGDFMEAGDTAVVPGGPAGDG